MRDMKQRNERTREIVETLGRTGESKMMLRAHAQDREAARRQAAEDVGWTWYALRI